MYCNNCGKQNPQDSKFCKHCGSEIKKVLAEHKVDTQAGEVSSSDPENKNTKQSNEKAKTPFSGWLALVGLGLILTPIIQGYGLLGYFSLFNETFDIPGYMSLLQMEFVASIVIIIASLYILYLYFKKSVNFPKYYIILLIASAVYTAIDHLLLASLTAPTPEQQKAITDALSQNSGEVGKSIFFAIIWVSYIIKSKKVKATFVNIK